MNPVDRHIEALPEYQQARCFEIREIIESIDDRISSLIKYRTPFFRLKYDFCYLSPQKEGLKIGFIRGKFLPDPEGVLTGQELKQVRHLEILWQGEIDHWLRFFILEAIELDLEATKFF